MNNSIQQFAEMEIPKLEQIEKKFFQNPFCFPQCVFTLRPLRRILTEIGCQFLSGMLEEYNTMLEGSVKRRRNWQIKDQSQKSLLASIGSISFTRTRFRNKTTGRSVYLLDQLMGLSPHVRSAGKLFCAMSIKQRSRFVRKRENRMSSRPMGWSRRGADQMARIRVYRNKGGDFRKMEKRKEETGRAEEERVFSAEEMLKTDEVRGKSAQVDLQVKLHYLYLLKRLKNTRKSGIIYLL